MIYNLHNMSYKSCYVCMGGFIAETIILEDKKRAVMHYYYHSIAYNDI